MPRSRAPRIGALAPSGRLDALRETGGEPVEFEAAGSSPKGGVALRREWIADQTQVAFSGENLDALLLDDAEPAELTGLLIAALRLDLPVVVAAPLPDPFAIALFALGFAPLTGDAVEVAVEVARNGGPRPRALIEGFSLANALRAGLSAGAGPELLVHLAAIAREAGVVGFGQMIQVLSPESPTLTTPGSPWFEKHGAAGLFAHLGDALHDTPSVTGQLKELLPPIPPAPDTPGSPRLVFVRGRASGTQAVCRMDQPTAEVAGECRVVGSEAEAIEAVAEGRVEEGNLLIVAGCGPLGGPGLLRLDRLGHALDEADMTIPVLTDGLAPKGAASLWTPEAAAGGVIGRLRDGDFLRLDLEEGRILTGIDAGELARREAFEVPTPSGFGYVARYVRSALPALEGAGFG